MGLRDEFMPGDDEVVPRKKVFEVSVVFNVWADSPEDAAAQLEQVFGRDDYAGHTEPMEIPQGETGDCGYCGGEHDDRDCPNRK